jgi:hypothetical protein
MKSNMPKPPTFKPINVKAEVDKHQRLSPHLPGDSHTKVTPAYVWKRSENPHLKNQAKSFSAGAIGKAIVGAGTALAAATILKQQATDRVGPKRNKTKAVESHKTRKPVNPKAPKIQARHIGTTSAAGANAQASPALKAASDKRRAAEGAKLKNAGYGKPEAPKAPVTPKPRSIVEMEEPKTPKAPKAPEVPKTPKVQTTPAQPAAAPKRTFFQGMRDAFTPANEFAEQQASKAALRAPVAETPEITTPVDKPVAEVEAKPEGRVARTVKAPARATVATVKGAKKRAETLRQSIADAANPAVASERKAAERAIVTPADAEATEFDNMTPDQRKAKQTELQARVEKGRATQDAKAAERKTKPKAVETPEVSAETKQLQKDLNKARKESVKLGGSEAKKKDKPPKSSNETTVVEATPAEAEEVKLRDVANAKKRAADLTTQVEAAEVAETAHQTSRSATSSEATKAAVPTSEETTKEAAKRKKATQKFYKGKGKRLEAQGSVRKGTSTAVSPAVVGASATPEIETPVHKKRKPTEELMKEQGIKVKEIPAKEAPETDATTEEWDKKKENAKATRTPLEQAKLDAKEMGIQIEETEARKSSLGSKLKEAAGVPTDTLTADMAKFEGQRIVQSKLNLEGEHVTTILEGDALEKTVADAQEDLRKGQDRRSGDATRRKFSERATAAEASKYVMASDRAPRPGETKPAVGAKKGSRRKTQPGGDQRQKGSTWKPIDLVEELQKPENQRPGGLPDRRGPSLMDLDVGELQDRAVRGDPNARETLKQHRAEKKSGDLMRRGSDVAIQERARLGLDIERAEAGVGAPESTSVWDPKAKHPKMTTMDVNADLMPEVKVYGGDPIKANTLENMNKNIENLQKRLNAPGAPELHKGQDTLNKLIRQRDGLAQEIKITNTRQFPTLEGVRTEQAVKPGAKVVPRTEARKHVRGPTGERNVPVPGTPEQRRTAPARGPVADPRTRPHVGPQRGSVTIPAPDLSVGEVLERERPLDWVKENPNMWDDSLRRVGHTQPPLTSPAIGSNIGENIWKAVQRVGKAALKPKNLARGVAGLGIGTAMFAVPEVASAYTDASGSTRDRIKAAGGQSLESGIEIGAGMALFTGGLVAAQKVAPALLKPLVGATGHVAGAAAVGYVAGSAAGGIYNRLKTVRDKNKRDTAHAQEKYGTVEAATRTRKGLNAQGKPMTLDDTEELAKRWERELAKRKKRPGAKE